MLGPYTAAVSTELASDILALVPILALFVLLVTKEVFGGLPEPRARAMSSALWIPILPLLLVFVITAVSRFAELV